MSCISSTSDRRLADLAFPRPDAPEPGELIEIAPGVLWLRLALPFALNHVNVYLIEDGPGWALLDTGVDDERTRAAWENVLARQLRGRNLTRLIITHYHPDHMGLAGWLAERCEIEVFMPQTEYLFAQNLRFNPDALASSAHRTFYRRGGLGAETTESVIGRGHGYLKLTSGLPPVYRRRVAGDSLKIGGRVFEVLTGAGHAPEQAMLLCRADGLFFADDQVLARISPNVSVWPIEPTADPLAAYLGSLSEVRELPGDLLVLAAHHLPFYGLHRRIDELARHHAQRCADIAATCSEPLSVAALLPVLFPRALDPHQTGFAFGEVLAHVSYMIRRGELTCVVGTDQVRRVIRA
jgi:glyoxylase-like metal-dependent hydrolase (beta-lactamase superfamily II)